jgi:hypothetical protein
MVSAPQFPFGLVHPPRVISAVDLAVPRSEARASQCPHIRACPSLHVSEVSPWSPLSWQGVLSASATVDVVLMGDSPFLAKMLVKLLPCPLVRMLSPLPPIPRIASA